MSDGIISFDTAVLSKEKNFDLNTPVYYNSYKEIRDDYIGIPNNKDIPFVISGYYTAPTQSVLQKWLRDEERLIFVSVERCCIGSDEWEFGYFIEYLPKENHEDKRRSGSFKEIKSFQDNYPHSYSGAWHTYEEALEKGLQKALTLINL